MQFWQFLLAFSILFITNKSISQENNPLEGKIFGYGSICIPHTMSEYQVVMEFTKNSHINYYFEDYLNNQSQTSTGTYQYDKNTNTIQVNFSKIIVDEKLIPYHRLKINHYEKLIKTQATAKIKYCKESKLMALEFTQASGFFDYL